MPTEEAWGKRGLKRQTTWDRDTNDVVRLGDPSPPSDRRAVHER